MKKFGIIGIMFCVVQMNLWSIPEFALPVGTPGRQEIVDPLGQVQADISYQNGKFCEHVIIPGTSCNLYFPTDGSQPSTADAGLWSGARYNMPASENNLVTNWWVRVFGGNQAVNLSRVGAPDIFPEPQMGFDAAGQTHIIQVNTTIAGTPASFERQFWRTFRDIAADPVGRVLLYRLLIEIRRTNNDTHEGCCGPDVILPAIFDIKVRNNYRRVKIRFGTFAFCPNNMTIRFIHNDAKRTRTLMVGTEGLTTQRTPRTTDIGLFHEMLHWFHQLRNPCKKKDNNNKNNRGFSYVTRCYYGDPARVITNYPGAFVWRISRKEADKINGEEIATILGSPNLNADSHTYVLRGVDLINYNAFYTVYKANYSQITINGVTQYIPNLYKFLNGEDLSENAYRISKRQPMRWGHVSDITIPFETWPNPPNHFRLAHKIASDCYQAITSNLPPNWGFIQGQAIK